MDIAICGLGLIGGSSAKAIKAKTQHRVYGFDISSETLDAASACGAIDERLTKETLSLCDIVIVALYPKASVDFVKSHARHIKKGSALADFCGVKRSVAEPMSSTAEDNGFTYVGCHPMAGIEKSGFSFSNADLFNGASMIMTPKEGDDESANMLSELFLAMGFGAVKYSTPFEHDKIVAYTSQLAHVLSSAYIKSEAALSFRGFSAGSFSDMTRVAYLNEEMWSELFLQNADFLSEEIDGLCERLAMYSAAVKQGDKEALSALLKEGKERKEFIEGN